MGISYVCTVKEDAFPLPLAHLNTAFETTPIFRIQKCINMKDLSTKNCCMIFVDVHARVYENWEAYCKENLLPECIIVAPKKGIFMGKINKIDEWEIDIEKFLSPAAQPTGRFAKYMDMTSTGLGLTASAVMIGTMFAPILAPAAGAAAVAGAVSGGWSILRSGQTLADRSQHEQSINMTDAGARSSWLGVAAGSLGFASGVAGKVLSSMATSGRTISPFLKITFTSLNASTLIVSGASTINGFIDVLFLNDDKPTAWQVAQLSASLFIFTHSVYNFQTANSLIRHIDIRDNLSVKQKRAFDKMAKETIRLNGESQGKADIIRSLRKVPDHKAYFRDMQKINKDLNSAKVKVSFGGDSEPLLNGQPSKAMPNEIRANLKAGSAATVFEGVAPHDPQL
uniref:Uncharacterized protein n=1 Tax=Phlebotomus papatasi TaxID=29031 RepID=A0A1B0CZ15_PHLPP